MRNSTKYLICEGLIVAAILLLLFFSLPGCKTVYRDIHHYDTVYTSKTKYDSLYLYDSIFVKEKGDTVFFDRTHFKTVYKEKTDTVYKYVSDTVKVPVIEKKVVETNKLNWWQKVLCWIGVVSILTAIFFVYKKIKR